MKSNQLYPMREAQFLKDGLYNLLDALENKIGPLNTKTMIEIGSYAGESSIIFAERFGFVLCIDPWIDDYDLNDATCHHAAMNIVEKEFEERTKSYLNISKFKSTSDEAIKLLKDFHVESADFVYIDGMHTYEQVCKDISNYNPILKETNSAIGGHDYSENWIGVKKAIDERLGTPDLVFCDTSWVKFK